MADSQPPPPKAPNETTSSPATEHTLAPHDQPDVVRQIQRFVTRQLPRLARLRQNVLEWKRRWQGEPHQIDFFHQVDDPYSELAIQAIQALKDRYDVEFRFHLVSQSDSVFAPEPELLAAYARRDCSLVASHYGLEFPAKSSAPTANDVERVEKALAASPDPDAFLQLATSAGRALWFEDDASIREIEANAEVGLGPAPSLRSEALQAGNALREKWGHYSGAMFHYGGTWYWGVDRLHHLEQRLIELGTERAAESATPRFARPAIDLPALADSEKTPDAALKLEIFPSLRSPYTAFIFERSLAVAKRHSVPTEVRPVLPMVMRGVPVPRKKAIYIMLDAVREARTIGAPFGNMLDPIGKPVERGFSLWPFARERGKGNEYLSTFLRDAFALGRPVGTDEALERIIKAVGLSFEDARPFLDGTDWKAELEANRLEMYYELGLWGVPAFRLSGSDGEPDLCIWGQDRLWLIASEIRRRQRGRPAQNANAG